MEICKIIPEEDILEFFVMFMKYKASRLSPKKSLYTILIILIMIVLFSPNETTDSY